MATLFNVNIQLVKSQPISRDIDIKLDGSILDTYSNTPILRNGNVYTFTSDIYGRIDVQKSNIIIDGAGYSLIKNELDFAIIVGTDGDVPEPVGVNEITIMNLHIIGFNYGITLGGESNVIQNVNLTDCQDYNGIPIWVSGSNHKITECRITDNQGFGMLINAKNTIISDNNISNNGNSGIQFYNRAVTLKNNTLNNNGGGPFLMSEMSYENPSLPFQISSRDIDPSNIVDGEPVYYWVNEHNKTVPSNAGYVTLDNCTNITVKDLSINRNSLGRFYQASSGIRLIRTRNSIISNNTLNGTGIYISYSSNDILVSNNKILYGGIHSSGSNISIIWNSIIASNDNGISLGGQFNQISKNNLTRCLTGIDLHSDQNKVTKNYIVDCDTGINLFSSDNNDFYQNNFINNTQHVSEEHYSLQWPLDTYYQSLNNTWNGNFWSNYNGTDSNGDGIGDISYIIDENNQDNYPFINPIDIETIPEFPSWTILPLSLIASIIVIVCKKKLTKT